METTPLPLIDSVTDFNLDHLLRLYCNVMVVQCWFNGFTTEICKLKSMTGSMTPIFLKGLWAGPRSRGRLLKRRPQRSADLP